MTCDACDGRGTVWVVSPMSRERAASLERSGEKVVYSPYAKPGPPYELPCPECGRLMNAAMARAVEFARRQMSLGYNWQGVIRGSGLV